MIERGARRQTSVWRAGAARFRGQGFKEPSMSGRAEALAGRNEETRGWATSRNRDRAPLSLRHRRVHVEGSKRYAT
jgi:hypothetical protein